MLDDGRDAAEGGAATVDGVTGGRNALRRWRVLMGNLVLHIANGKSALAGPYTVRRHIGASLSGRPHEVRQQVCTADFRCQFRRGCTASNAPCVSPPNITLVIIFLHNIYI